MVSRHRPAVRERDEWLAASFSGLQRRSGGQSSRSDNVLSGGDGMDAFRAYLAASDGMAAGSISRHAGAQQPLEIRNQLTREPSTNDAKRYAPPKLYVGLFDEQPNGQAATRIVGTTSVDIIGEFPPQQSILLSRPPYGTGFFDRAARFAKGLHRVLLISTKQLPASTVQNTRDLQYIRIEIDNQSGPLDIVAYNSLSPGSVPAGIAPRVPQRLPPLSADGRFFLPAPTWQIKAVAMNSEPIFFAIHTSREMATEDATS